ncbi:hypothetical protein [Variovorax atrisoli]|uniref:hypothetical protein n=1 Tax=Variovorax atrisoli TaxID=3394203 RepID=UPI00404015B0
MTQATYPEAYSQPRVINGRVRTCRLIEIGCAYTPPPGDPSGYATIVQSALLAPPTRGQRFMSWLSRRNVIEFAVAIALLTGAVAVALDLLVFRP